MCRHDCGFQKQKFDSWYSVCLRRICGGLFEENKSMPIKSHLNTKPSYPDLFFSTFFLLTSAIECNSQVLKLKIPFIFSMEKLICINSMQLKKSLSPSKKLLSSRTRKLMPSILMEATSTQQERVLVWYLLSGRATQVSAIHCHCTLI